MDRRELAFLLCGGAEEELFPVLTGGTGSESIRQEMPLFLPDRGEAGTENVAGVAGLLEGVRFVRRTGVEQIARYERSLLTRMVQGLHALEEIQVFASQTQNQTGVVSFVCPQYDSQLMAQALGRREIAVRGGLHCAPQAHRSAGTLDTGTVRVSFSAFNQGWEVDAFLQNLQQIIHDKLT